MAKLIPDKQLSIPGLPVLLPKNSKLARAPHTLTQDERIAFLESRVFQLEMEIALLRIQLDREGKDHA